MSEVSNCTHYFIIDCYNVGRCKYCPEVGDFSKLQRHESKLLGLTAKSGGTKGKRGKEQATQKSLSSEHKRKIGEAVKERWQDPEYRGVARRKPKYE